MPGSRVPALVFGADVTALAVLRALGRDAVPVFVAGSRPKLVTRSRWYRPVPGDALDETSDGERAARYLEASPFPRAVLFPCSDHWALALASLPDRAAAAYPAVVAPLETLRVLVDKSRFAEATTRLGVPAPRTLPVVGVETLAAIEEAELPNFFLKPSDSQQFAKRFGVKGLQLTGRTRAADLVRQLTGEGFELVLQEYLPGPATDHVFLDGYVDRAGVMRACLARRRMRMFPPHLGNSTLSVTMPLSEAGDAVASLQRLFEGMEFTGLFDAEFKYDARDGRFKILEVNARPWWQLGLSEACGLGLTVMAYRDALGLPLAPAARYPVGHAWVNPVPDLRAWWGRGAGGHAGGVPVRSWLGGANAVFSWDDPMPAVEALARVPGGVRGEARRSG
jgi:D-aspartate ligase